MLLINPLAHLQGGVDLNILLRSRISEFLLVQTDSNMGDAWQNYELIDVIKGGRILRKACWWEETQVCLKAASQSASEWKLSINKRVMPVVVTALLGKDEEWQVETSSTLHPSLPLRHSLIHLSHLGGAEIAWLLHSYKLTPNKTCPRWLLAPHRLWLKPFCLGTAGVHKVTAHSRQAHNGMRTEDCMEPSVKYALIALMAESIDTPYNLSFVSGLKGLLKHPEWRAVLKLGARQRALKWNFNELQYVLARSVIYLFDLEKKGDACGCCCWNNQLHREPMCSRQCVTSV